MDVIDIQFQGRGRVIGTAVLRGADGITLVDPGPTSCLPALEEGLGRLGATLGDVRRILLTHIHLDHAGAAGTIVGRVPQARVFVHLHGAPHLIYPTKLLASATRLYGDAMDRLWGAFEPVPAGNVQVLHGGERLDVAGRAFRVAYTPGHAIHHVSYLDERDGLAYVGDTCGIRVAGELIVAATPPPDIDLESWNASLDLIEGWQPAALLLTHFGLTNGARAHLSAYRGVLARTAELVRLSLNEGESDASRAAAFADRMRAEAGGELSDYDARSLELAAPFEQIWAGLARYWRKRPAAEALRTPGA